jgi:chromosome segregation protein
MRRWDGFVAEAGGAAAAERLIRVNRLAEIERSLPALDAAVASAITAATKPRKRSSNIASMPMRRGPRLRRPSARAGGSAGSDAAAAALERLDAQRTALASAARIWSHCLHLARFGHGGGAALEVLPHPARLAGEIEQAREVHRRRTGSRRKRAAARTRAREMAADVNAMPPPSANRASGERVSAMPRHAAGNCPTRRGLATERRELADEPERLAVEIDKWRRTIRRPMQRSPRPQPQRRRPRAWDPPPPRELAEAGEAFAGARETRAGAVARAEAQEARRAELARQCSEQFECPPTLLPERLGFDACEARRCREREGQSRSHDLRARADRGRSTLSPSKELAELEDSRLAGAAERDELQEAINRLRGSIGSPQPRREGAAARSLQPSRSAFPQLFTTLFDGGQAHLELVESDDPLEAGLEIMASRRASGCRA